MATLSISFSTSTNEETNQAITASSVEPAVYQKQFDKSFQFDNVDIVVCVILSVVIFKLAQKCIDGIKTIIKKEKENKVV